MKVPTTSELINSIIAAETEDGRTVVIQDTTLRGYLNQVAKSAVEEERRKTTNDLLAKIGG